MNFGLFVLEGDVEGHDVAVLDAGGHAFMATTVVEDKSLDEARLCGHLVLHVHDLDHVEIDWLVGLADGLDCLNEDLGKGLSNGRVDLGHEGGTSNIQEELTLNLSMSNL